MTIVVLEPFSLSPILIEHRQPMRNVQPHQESTRALRCICLGNTNAGTIAPRGSWTRQVSALEQLILFVVVVRTSDTHESVSRYICSTAVCVNSTDIGFISAAWPSPSAEVLCKSRLRPAGGSLAVYCGTVRKMDGLHGYGVVEDRSICPRLYPGCGGTLSHYNSMFLC